MGRGVSCGGGQSSLGYLFGNGGVASKAAAPVEAAQPAPKPAAAALSEAAPPAPKSAAEAAPPAPKPASPRADSIKQIPAGIQGGTGTNNYFRADGQNSGNFITDRPSTKVHSAPGGGSSLNYLFGGNGN